MKTITLALTLLVLAVGSIVAEPAMAAKWPTLNGEVITYSGGSDGGPICDDGYPGPTSNAGGGNYGFPPLFQVGPGSASGPYPGSVREQGGISVGGGTTRSFNATFDINGGQVTGTKTLDTSRSSTGSCSDGPSPLSWVLEAAFASRYVAAITTPRGTFADRGTASTRIVFSRSFFPYTGYTLHLDLQETFTSDSGKPGKGCRDKTHEHERAAECKQSPV